MIVARRVLGAIKYVYGFAAPIALSIAVVRYPAYQEVIVGIGAAIGVHCVHMTAPKNQAQLDTCNASAETSPSNQI